MDRKPRPFRVGVVHVIFVFIGVYVDRKKSLVRQQEQEDRRIQQNSEWDEQFLPLSADIHAAIRMIPEDQRVRASVIALLIGGRYHHYSRIRRNFLRSKKVKTDWKKEGF